MVILLLKSTEAQGQVSFLGSSFNYFYSKNIQGRIWAGS